MIHTTITKNGEYVIDGFFPTMEAADVWAGKQDGTPTHEVIPQQLPEAIALGEDYLIQFGFDPATREAFATQAFLSTLNPSAPGAWTVYQIQKYAASAAWVIAFWQGAKAAVAAGQTWSPSGQPPYNQTAILEP